MFFLVSLAAQKIELDSKHDLQVPELLLRETESLSKQIQNVQEVFDNQSAKICQTIQLIKSKDLEIKQKTEKIKDQETVIEKSCHDLKVKDCSIALDKILIDEQTRRLTVKDLKIESLKAKLAEQLDTTTKCEQIMTEKVLNLEKELNAKSEHFIKEVEYYSEQLSKNNEVIEEKNQVIEEKNQVIEEKDETIEALSKKLLQYDNLHDSSWLEASKSSVPWKINRFTITRIPQRVIGCGAWGRVCSGEFRGEKVAIKYVHSGLLQIQGTLEMIKREINIMAHIHHPNLVRFIGAVVDDAVDARTNVPIIVLELLDMNLRTAYNQERLKKADIISIFCDIAYALHYLHEQSNSIIHRDISTPNVLLKRLPGNSFRAKVSDFGSANLVKHSKTAGAGAILYTAPEMFPPQDIMSDPAEQTVKVDVYSYGIVLLEVVVGELPVIEKRAVQLKSCKLKWEQVYGIIINCTKPSPTERSTMREILNLLLPMK